MAYINDTAFEVKVSNHEFDSIANVTGVFYGASEAEACSAGFLCVRDERLEGILRLGVRPVEPLGLAALVGRGPQPPLAAPRLRQLLFELLDGRTCDLHGRITSQSFRGCTPRAASRQTLARGPSFFP